MLPNSPPTARNGEHLRHAPPTEDLTIRSRRTRRSRSRLVLAVCLYGIVVQLVYATVVADTYEYVGFGPASVGDFGLLFLTWVATIVPALWMPLQLTRPSVLLFLTLYLFIYVPTVQVVHTFQRPSLADSDVALVVAVLLIGISIVQLTYRMPLLRVRSKVVANPYWAVRLMLLGAAVLGMYFLYRQGAAINFASFDEVYEQRAAVSALGNGLTGYALVWITGFALPLAIAAGLFTRRAWLVALGLLGFVVLYGVAGNKSHLVGPVFTIAVYFWVTRYSGRTELAVTTASSILAVSIPFKSLAPGAGAWYVALLPFRSVFLPALLVAQYYDFAIRNGPTLWSHIGLTRLASDAEAPELIYLTIGRLYAGAGTTPVANASPWAVDGFASFGAPGVILVSVAIGAVFLVLDSAASRYDPRFVAVLLSFLALSWVNVPLTTSLVSGGLIWIVLVLWMAPDRETAAQGSLWDIVGRGSSDQVIADGTASDTAAGQPRVL